MAAREPSSASAVGTLVGKPSTFTATPPKLPAHWVPDPLGPENASRPRTLVLCFDGTGDQFDDDNSNVVNFVTMLKKDDQKYQLVYYQTGIGTYTKNSFVTPALNQISRTLDEMFAWNLGSHVMDGYEFLMQNYTAGDKISIFGFSRGAYTARALAGMVQKVGLLPTCNAQQIPFAWAMYNREDLDGLKLSVAFKKSFSIDVTIDFVGVWDTVASVGITNRELPFVGNNHAIRVFRHALALDEHRAKFMPNFYHASPTENIVPTAVPAATPNGKKKRVHERSQTEIWEDSINAQNSTATDALEVWFAGCHCDVGGGSVDNGVRNNLARIPLRWMIRECFRTHTGIIFDAAQLKLIGLDPATVYPVVLDRPPRLRPTVAAKITEAPSGPWFIVTVGKAIGTIIWVPLKLLFTVVTWPLKHLWLLLHYSSPAKWLRWKLGFPDPAKEPADVPQLVVQDRAPPAMVNEEQEELEDALCPVYDQLKISWFWWIIELLPMKHRSQKGSRADYYVRSNLGKGRKIYGDAREGGLKVHRSVKTRLEVENAKGQSLYKPNAWFRVRKSPGGPKVEGPVTWNVDNPDPIHQWQWVE